MHVHMALGRLSGMLLLSAELQFSDPLNPWGHAVCFCRCARITPKVLHALMVEMTYWMYVTLSMKIYCHLFFFKAVG